MIPVTVRIQPPTAHVETTRVALRRGRGRSRVVSCSAEQAPLIVEGVIAALDHEGVVWRLAEGYTRAALA